MAQRSVPHDPVRDMYYFDRLPKTVRQALANAVCGLSSEHTYDAWRKIGAGNTIRLIKETDAKMLQGWDRTRDFYGQDP